MLLAQAVREVIDVATDAVDINISAASDGSGVIKLTVHDERLEERVQLLRARGATKHCDTWRLEVGDVGEIGDISGHILGLMADLLNPPSSAGGNRTVAIDRDGNRCRLCGRDFSTATADRHTAGRVVDHMYPKHEGGPQHGVHQPYNLVTVCRGCDDVFLQGDGFRFIPAHIKTALTPFDRQLLAWLQKRGLVRSDWVAEKLDTVGRDNTGHEHIRNRLRTFAGHGIVQQFPDIATEREFDVFAITPPHRAVAFLDTQAVERHTRLPVDTGSPLTETAVIEMSERRTPATDTRATLLSESTGNRGELS